MKRMDLIDSKLAYLLPRVRALRLGVVLLVAVIATSAAAQTTSTIEGTVKDSSDAVIAGATIKVSGTALATERTATSNSSGTFRVTALPAGTYTVVASQPGFAMRSFDNIELTLNRVLTLDVQLDVGAVQERTCRSTAGTILTCCNSSPESPSIDKKILRGTMRHRCSASAAATQTS